MNEAKVTGEGNSSNSSSFGNRGSPGGWGTEILRHDRDENGWWQYKEVKRGQILNAKDRRP